MDMDNGVGIDWECRGGGLGREEGKGEKSGTTVIE